MYSVLNELVELGEIQMLEMSLEVPAVQDHGLLITSAEVVFRGLCPERAAATVS